jgi:phosphopantothenoylcysteine synthetase/decarboxylase
MSSDPKVLYIVVCAAGPAGDVGKLVDLAQERGWTVQVIATPSAVAMIDTEALEQQTGRPVRSQHRSPGQPRSPKADAIIIAPATFNTINKLANGIADNYALDVINEAIGMGIEILIAPYLNAAYANRKALDVSISRLTEERVRFYPRMDDWTPHEPGKGRSHDFEWNSIIRLIEREGRP